MSDEQGQDPSKEDLMGEGLGEEHEFIAEKAKEVSAKLQAAKEQIGSVVWGQDDVIDMTITCMVAGGHLIQEGVPGLAKTRMVSAIAQVMGLTSKRIQFTPDLLPSDILGSEVLKTNEDGSKEFEFIEGPVFTQFLMADEINRAGPKTQSALLEAMQEKKVTVNGQTRLLQRPYTVMATQNPLEQEGTYPLPEAQLDRFLMKLDVDYPDRDADMKIMMATTGTSASIRDLFDLSAAGEDLTVAKDKDEVLDVEAALDTNDLVIYQKMAQRLLIPEKVAEAIIEIVHRARPEDEAAPQIVKDNVMQGPGPRAMQAFARAARARALMRGDIAATIDDVKALVKPILTHRVVLSHLASGNDVDFDKVAEALTAGIGLEEPQAEAKGPRRFTGRWQQKP